MSTKPTAIRGEYASVAAIAKVWTTPKGKEHINCFIKNTAHGITTFQDKEIEYYLKHLGCY